ncbi:hypothetical protein B0J12DRAFT_790868 [Macrophomina phaseolina]|uniref:Uncharacterized protein n=1 Tax=Macrophomina phaseolina TaxID=35725 RepID=A0ABQ8FQJ9_9PEZI|nr:hypothetical protein B0J12DRAFT_790868 [Macrophomina phaseolina]
MRFAVASVIAALAISASASTLDISSRCADKQGVWVWSCKNADMAEWTCGTRFSGGAVACSNCQALDTAGQFNCDYAHTLNGPSRRRLRTLADAAHKSFAERALLLEENQLLLQENRESKRRKSTKSTMVGKAKVMSYGDIVEAQAKRAAEDAVKEVAAAKGKRGRKRKGPVPAGAKAKKARRSAAEVAEDEPAAAGMENYCSILQF